MLNIILFGPPGAGKGTQADILIDKFGLLHISTGDLLRSEIAKMTILGVKAKSFIDKGELVSDDIVIDIIKTRIDSSSGIKGIIFDGFPRTVAQAEALDILLEKNETPVSGMISLEVDKQELINRLLERGKVSGRSDDQDISIIENRIVVYNNKTAPLIEYYKNQNKYYPVKGVGTIEEIAANLAKVVEDL